MNIFKKIIKFFLLIITIPIVYLIISLILTEITIDRKDDSSISIKKHMVFLSTNGVHLDIIIPKKYISTHLLKGLITNKTTKYISFGWGDENFYINTPTWSDLTFSNAVTALFLESPTLMHITRYYKKESDWTKIKLTTEEFEKLNNYIDNTFKKDKKGYKIILNGKGYSKTDDFYRANGNYHCFKTCNSWVNTAFKKSGLKCCLWTPFDYGLIKKYN